MSINATQSHSGEHLLAVKAVCNPEICLEKKEKKIEKDFACCFISLLIKFMFQCMFYVFCL